MEELGPNTATPWMQQVDEPNEWHDKFLNYYLPLGPTRTLLRAFIDFAMATSPEQKILMSVRRPASAPASWSTMAREWEWRKRASAFDLTQMEELVATKDMARLEVQMATLDAVRALKLALLNPRTAVNAAKEILDRGGLPAVTVHIGKTVPFTADDLANAMKELDNWKQQRPLPPPRNLLEQNG
jgi:hypothetical protein